MSPRFLLDHFDLLAEAPGGVARLRELVLHLAVRGKLVAQDPADEPASELLKRIAKERARLVKEGKIRAGKPLPPVGAEEAPFEVPAGWVWCRLDELPAVPLTDGDWIETKDQDINGDVRLIQLADVGVGEFRDRSSRFLTSATTKRLNCTLLEPGDVLIARLPSPIGRACIFPGLGQPAVTAVDVAIARLTKSVDRRYLVSALNSGVAREQVESYGKGATRFRVSTGHLRTILLPLPPLAEQHRIVARVEELMALLDRLEAARGERDTTRLAARDSALAALRDAADASEVAAAWRRLEARLDDLFQAPEDVPPLRQAILQLAVRGRLVAQDPADEPASELLKRIAKERARLVKEGKIRAGKPLPPVGAEEVPFEVPEGWVWTCLGEVGNWGSGSTPLRSQPKYFGGPHNWFKSGELNDGVLDCPSEEQITDDALNECSLRVNAPGDVLMAMYGATVGRLAILKVPATTNQAVCACTCFRAVFNEFLFIFLKASREYFIRSSAGAAQPNFSKDKIVTTMFPLPPLPEQHRIVARVDQLNALCDRLESRLAAARDAQTALAAALLHQVTQPDFAA